MPRGHMLLRMEDTRAVAGWMGAQELLQGHVATPEDVVQEIDAITPEDTARVGQLLLDPDKLRLAVVGPHRSDKLFRKLLRF